MDRCFHFSVAGLRRVGSCVHSRIMRSSSQTASNISRMSSSSVTLRLMISRTSGGNFGSRTEVSIAHYESGLTPSSFRPRTFTSTSLYNLHKPFKSWSLETTVRLSRVSKCLATMICPFPNHPLMIPLPHGSWPGTESSWQPHHMLPSPTVTYN